MATNHTHPSHPRKKIYLADGRGCPECGNVFRSIKGEKVAL